ncbi:MFS transporter [Bradyrhizobium sp. 14AA]
MHQSITMSSSSIGARLDRIPLSKFHYRMLTLIALGLFVDSFEVMIMGGVLAALVQSGVSDFAQNAKFISATFAGLAAGALFAGVIGDKFGRKASYQFNLLLFGLLSFLAAFAPSMSWLIVIRFFMGIGLGAEFVIGYGFISEFVPPAVRGRSIAVAALVSNSGQLIASLVALAVIPTLGWRWMFAIAGVMALSVWMLRKNMPESARWLESVGRIDEADRIVSHIEVEAGMEPGPKPLARMEIVREGAFDIRELFRSALLGRTLIGMLLAIVVLTGNYGFIAWIPTFLVKQGHNVFSSLWISTLMAVGSICGPLLGLWISDNLGRRYSIALVAVFTAVVGVIYPNVTSISAITICGFLLQASILLLIALGIGTYLPELFPTNYRLRGSGLAQFAGRVATIFTPFLVVALFESFGVGGVIYSIAGLYILLSITLVTFGIETKNRPLERIN